MCWSHLLSFSARPGVTSLRAAVPVRFRLAGFANRAPGRSVGVSSSSCAFCVRAWNETHLGANSRGEDAGGGADGHHVARLRVSESSKPHGDRDRQHGVRELEVVHHREGGGIQHADGSIQRRGEDARLALRGTEVLRQTGHLLRVE